MKKIIYLIIFVILSLNILAEPYPICEPTKEIPTNCTMVTPILTCPIYQYDIINLTGELVVTNGTLYIFDSTNNLYYFNFTQPQGDYVVTLCDGSTREIRIVESTNNKYYLYLIAIVFMFFLIYIGYTYKNIYPIILSGMLSIFIAWNIYNNGYPLLADPYLKDAISAIFGGLGLYFIIAPIVIDLQEKYK